MIPVLTTHILGEVAAIAPAIPNDRVALQWDVCQEVIAWEGYYEPGPVDFRTETIAELIEIGNGVPTAIELGYHLCYGRHLWGLDEINRNGEPAVAVGTATASLGQPIAPVRTGPNGT